MAANRVRSKGIDKVRRTMPTRPSVIVFEEFVLCEHRVNVNVILSNILAPEGHAGSVVFVVVVVYEKQKNGSS